MKPRRNRVGGNGFRVVAAIAVLAGVVVIVLLALGVVGARAAAVSVSIQSSAFSPNPITINVGDTITWTNDDQIPHTTTSNTGIWNSGNLGPGAKFSRTFNQAGTFDYLCTIHLFTGRVIVLAPSTTTTASTTTTTQPGTGTFADVPEGSPFFVAIQGLAQAGVIGGYDIGGGLKEFRPQSEVLRAQFTKILVGALGIPVVPNAFIPFTDVDRDANGYPWDFVAAAYHNNITQGRTATLFAPYVNVLRGQVTTLVVRALQQLHPGLLQDPPLSYQNTWGTGFSPIHGPLARIAEFNELLAGLPLSTTSSDPLGPMTRGEVAQVLWNVLLFIRP
ncbi:MAG: S-layer homology domain-containing protein [Actinobacteria bacterium]|nr:S-layer homology domain-containing protein [Actinomycetota bacterium]